MLVITGLPNCGTSFLAKVLMAMNYKGGVDLNSECELSSVYDLNQDMYSINGSINLDSECQCDYWKNRTYRYAIHNYDKDEKQGTVSFINDLTFMRSPEIIKAWWEVRKDLRFIILRNSIPDKVSHRRIRLMKEQEIPCKVQSYPEFLDNAQPLFKNIRTLGLQTCHIEGNKLVQEMREFANA